MLKIALHAGDFHKVAEAEVEAASRGASEDEVAHMTGQPETPSQWQFHNTYQAECSHMSHVVVLKNLHTCR